MYPLMNRGDLVKLCGQSFDWKKSTTYTVLKKLCEQKILKNEQAVVTSLIKEEQYHQLQGQEFINENYGGSLPRFLAAFMNQKKLSRKQVEEIRGDSLEILPSRLLASVEPTILNSISSSYSTS